MREVHTCGFLGLQVCTSHLCHCGQKLQVCSSRKCVAQHTFTRKCVAHYSLYIHTYWESARTFGAKRAKRARLPFIHVGFVITRRMGRVSWPPLPRPAPALRSERAPLAAKRSLAGPAPPSPQLPRATPAQPAYRSLVRLSHLRERRPVSCHRSGTAPLRPGSTMTDLDVEQLLDSAVDEQKKVPEG